MLRSRGLERVALGNTGWYLRPDASLKMKLLNRSSCWNIRSMPGFHTKNQKSKFIDTDGWIPILAKLAMLHLQIKPWLGRGDESATTKYIPTSKIISSWNPFWGKYRSIPQNATRCHRKWLLLGAGCLHSSLIIVEALWWLLSGSFKLGGHLHRQVLLIWSQYLTRQNPIQHKFLELCTTSSLFGGFY